MDESRRQKRSPGARRREQSDAQFWSNQLDQAEAIQLVRTAVNHTETTTPITVPDTSVTQSSESTTEPNMTDAS